ncbi:ABC transporter ATP-binding protein [Paracoccus caeni]|uniref:ABC transporter ATP-binding protein n=1 Tax=Paracoccus caeni TaxID=657651 RepID=A0A934VYJ4_9RHOB|nr:ABC transporter ATP-binding protein [Paracoccus caeni]MBK4214308.1 ABC transporter ATP-binding protein [Paracoccus caeni]
MIRGLTHLLGPDHTVLRRYIWLALVSGVLNGLTIAAIAPVLTRLLHGDIRAALPWLCAMLIGVLICWLWRRRVEMAGVDVGIAVLGRGRARIGNHVSSLPAGWFTPDNTARLSHVITDGVMEVAQLPAHVFTPVLSGMVVPVTVSLALLALDWRMGLLALVALPIMAVVFGLAARLGASADAVWHQSAAETSARAVEFAHDQAVMRAFGGGTDFLDQAVAFQQKTGGRLIRLSLLSGIMNGWLVQTVFAGLLIIGLQKLAPGASSQTIIAAVVSLLLASRFVEPLLEVAAYAGALHGARGQLDAIDAILSATPLPEPDRPQLPADSTVELRNVTFRYSPGALAVLDDVSFRIAPGEMVALVGASGSGKTTILRLVARFLDPEDGCIAIGGIDLRCIGARDLTASISQVFQESWLFSGTIRENILLGRARASDAELAEAIRLAGMDEIIARLPDGLEAEVGGAGSLLSGGERQRVAIARALIKRAPILLVDEATAALDAENEAIIADALAGLRGKATIIVIAHRPATLRMADRILTLAQGKLIKNGSSGGARGEP